MGQSSHERPTLLSGDRWRAVLAVTAALSVNGWRALHRSTRDTSQPGIAGNLAQVTTERDILATKSEGPAKAERVQLTTYEAAARVAVPAVKVHVHDHRTSTRAALINQLKSTNPTIEITCTEDSFALVDQFAARRPAVVLIGIRRGDAAGTDALNLLMSLHADAPIIAFGVPSDGLLLAAAVRRGARGLMLCESGSPDPSTEPHLRTGGGFSAGEPDSLNLTVREDQVLRGMSQGKSNGEIGRELYLAEDTIKTHARRLFDKLGALDRAHAVALALRRGHLD